MKIVRRWNPAEVIATSDEKTLKALAEESKADLGGADLRRATLRRATLRGATLRRADLTGADLAGAHLGGADLTGADLYEADLRGADLRGAHLGGADLRGADLGGADLGGADLRGADLTGADLTGADLTGADLTGAHLRGADLGGTENTPPATLPHFQIPQEGTLIVWGKKAGVLCQFEIPAAAKRTACLVNRKCRAAAVKTLWIDGDQTEVIVKNAYGETVYRIGDITTPHDYCDDPRIDCAPGIHVWLTRAEAEAW